MSYGGSYDFFRPFDKEIVSSECKKLNGRIYVNLKPRTYDCRDTMLVRWFPQRAAVGYSRWIDRSIHLCFRTPRARFPRTRLLSHVPVVLSTLAVTRTTGGACDLGFGASPSRGIAPSRQSVGLALLQRYSLRSPTHDRPHVSVSEALRSALASCGILSDTPYGWYLLTS
jgi:hypothetical protein